MHARSNASVLQNRTETLVCSVREKAIKSQEVIESLTLYKFEDLQSATGSFSKANRIKGLVFQGKFKGDDVAVKVLKGDVSNEINILRKINHSTIIRLSGFCVHEGNTYLVYEFAENGSLSDWLHESPNSTLSWKQRISVAYGVAEAINYLHNYTNPPYIHKNLKSSSNITAPLRCACPADGQVAAGVKYLVTYVTDWDDSVYVVSELFNVSDQSVLDANELSTTMTIYPFNPLLVPLTTEPTKIVFTSPPRPPAASPPSMFPTTGSGSTKKWIYIMVRIGVGVFLILAVAFTLWFYRS